MTISPTRFGFAGLLMAACLLAGCQRQSASGDQEDTDPAIHEYVLGSDTDTSAPSDFPQWAFPGPLTKSLGSSKAHFSDVQLYDRTTAIDWYPETHPKMPDIVSGRPSVYACGFCHLPQGAGRSENAALAGLPEKYIIQQVHDFQAGLRKTPDRKFGPAVNMEMTASHASNEDVLAAAKYFSSLTFAKHLKVVEAESIPDFTQNAFVYVFSKGGYTVPLGQRIIEGPDDFERFEMRDPNMTFTAYVPKGAIARGAELAKGNENRPACQSCHGENFTGSEIAPPLAGRLPTGLFRQLYGFKTKNRNGAGAALMQPVAADLSQKDMIDLAAYLASRNP